MIIIPLADYQYVIRLQNKYSRKQFLKKCEITEETYGETFALGIYNKLFEGAIDVKNEYKKYYSDEYESIRDFMFWRYCISLESLDEVLSDIGRSSYIGIFRDNSWHLEENNIFTKAFLELLE